MDGRTGVIRRSFGTYGDQVDQFNWPFGTSITRTGTLLVADWSNHRVQELHDMMAGDGGAVTMLGVGLLQFPWYVALTPVEDAVALLPVATLFSPPWRWTRTSSGSATELGWPQAKMC